MVPSTKKQLRALGLNSDTELVEVHPWLKDVPYDRRDGDLADILNATKGMLT